MSDAKKPRRPIRCVFGRHQWVVGRSVSSDVRREVPGWKNYHNRACARCGKEDLAADRAFAEAQRLREIRGYLQGPTSLTEEKIEASFPAEESIEAPTGEELLKGVMRRRLRERQWPRPKDDDDK